MAKKLTVAKAKRILKDNKIRGKPLSPRQQSFFGIIAGGGKPRSKKGK